MKRRIHLTEGDLTRIVRESVAMAIRESDSTGMEPESKRNYHFEDVEGFNELSSYCKEAVRDSAIFSYLSAMPEGLFNNQIPTYENFANEFTKREGEYTVGKMGQVLRNIYDYITRRTEELAAQRRPGLFNKN